MIHTINGYKTEFTGDPAFIAPSADILGNVEIGEGVSIWFNAVVRGDEDRIVIGRGSNIQDGCVLHVDEGAPLYIGEYVTVGHLALLHGCRIGANTLVGMHATIMNNAEIGENCLIGAGTLITENRKIPDGSLVLGAPGRVVKALTEEQIAKIRASAEHYIQRGRTAASQKEWV